MYSSGNKADHGFTLLELLIVLAIITLLFGLLMSPIRAVRHLSRVTMAHNELKTIESAWKEYYAVYHCWPTNALSGGDTLLINNADENRIADVLQGHRIEISADNVLNPKQIQFIEFTRFYGEKENAQPANPWCDQSAATNRYVYSTKFDVDYDNIIEHGNEKINRSVIVYTTDTDTGEILGSWQQ